MSTATKLEYLNETKSLLKDSINSLGGNITSQTTFRQYATELDSIYASLPKVSGTGSNISLTPTIKGRLGSTLKGNTLQDGTPTPSTPVEIQSVTGLQTIDITGKNLFTAGIEETTNTGVTANYNESEIKLNGTTSRDGNIFYDSTLGAFNSYRKIGNFVAGTYIVSFKKVSGSLVKTNGGATALYIRNSNNQSVANLNITEYTESTNSTITIEQDTTLYVQYFSNRAGIEYTDYIFTLQLEKGSTTTPYQPYITPRQYEVDLKTNKLYDGDYITGTPNNWSIVRENGEVVLDGDEGFSYTNGVFYKNNFISFNSSKVAYSNYFGYGGTCTNTTTAYNNGNNKISFNSNDNASIYLRNDDLTSSSAWNTWLSTHNVKVVYPLATPTTETITDTDLIEDLNNLYYAQSNDDTTNISVSGNLPMILSVSALKGE